MASILVVEDDKDLNKAYQLILEKSGHTVKVAFNGDEALDELKTFNPDLILLDLLMPVRSGIEFLKKYDLASSHPDVSVIVFTNLESDPQIDQAFDLGVQKCVVKSWTPPQGLIKVVDGVLGAKQTATKA